MTLGDRVWWSFSPNGRMAAIVVGVMQDTIDVRVIEKRYWQNLKGEWVSRWFAEIYSANPGDLSLRDERCPVDDDSSTWTGL